MLLWSMKFHDARTDQVGILWLGLIKHISSKPTRTPQDRPIQFIELERESWQNTGNWFSILQHP